MKLSNLMKKKSTYIAVFFVIYNLKFLIKSNNNVINDTMSDTYKKKNQNKDKKGGNLKNDSDIVNFDNIFKSKRKIKISYKNEDRVVLFKPKKLSNYNLKDIYNNFFNYKPKTYSDEVIIENILFTENKSNIQLTDDNNFIFYTFKPKKGYSYKIKFNSTTTNVKSIKLIVSNNREYFNYENMDENNIDDYQFILDNLQFDCDDIDIYIHFYKDQQDEEINNNQENENIIINNMSFTIDEKDVVNNRSSLIIFSINDFNYPIFLKSNNIFNFTEHI